MCNFVFILSTQVFGITYINESYWNQIHHKISFEGIDEEQNKLCYFLGINCTSPATDPRRRLSH